MELNIKSFPANTVLKGKPQVHPEGKLISPLIRGAFQDLILLERGRAGVHGKTACLVLYLSLRADLDPSLGSP